VEKIILVGRRKVDVEGAKVEQRVVDFDALSSHSEAFNEANVAICCLGTTRGKAGKEGFIKVDHDYVLESADNLKKAGCQDFHLLTSKGASENAFFLYPQVIQSSIQLRLLEAAASLLRSERVMYWFDRLRAKWRRQ